MSPGGTSCLEGLVGCSPRKFRNAEAYNFVLKKKKKKKKTKKKISKTTIVLHTYALCT